MFAKGYTDRIGMISRLFCQQREYSEVNAEVCQMDKTTEQSVAIVRPLRHFEVDRYWVKVAALAVRHSWSVVFDQFSWRRLMMPALVAVVASGIQFYVMGWASTEDNIKILGTSVAAGLCVFGVLVVIHLVRKPCELQINATEEIARLVTENERLRKPPAGLALSEEDPIVNFDPLNSEFLSQGYVPFMLSNKGQRVNPAHGVTVLPIQCAPSVRFEYVMHMKLEDLTTRNFLLRSR
jgi:hypothetical protein